MVYDLETSHLDHDRPASASIQDGYSIGQDRKCVRQVVRLTTGRLQGGSSQGLDKELGWVGEISKMFDILPIHCDKLGSYNQPQPTLQILLSTLKKFTVTNKTAPVERPHK